MPIKMKHSSSHLNSLAKSNFQLTFPDTLIDASIFDFQFWIPLSGQLHNPLLFWTFGFNKCLYIYLQAPLWNSCFNTVLIILSLQQSQFFSSFTTKESKSHPTLLLTKRTCGVRVLLLINEYFFILSLLWTVRNY